MNDLLKGAVLGAQRVVVESDVDSPDVEGVVRTILGPEALQDLKDGVALRRLREALPDDGFRYSIRVGYDHAAVSVGRWDVRFDGEHPRLHTREGAYGIGHGETLSAAADECRTSAKRLDR